jgi:hypothetical protein
MMLSFSLEDIILLVGLWLICGFVSAALFMRFITMRYAGRAVIDALLDPDEDTKAALMSMMAMILEMRFRTGKKYVDDDGKEQDETVSFVHYVGQEAWRIISLKMRAAKGGSVTQFAQSDEGQMLMGFAGPRKGQTTGEYLMEQAMSRAMPLLEKKVEELLSKRNAF